MRRIRHTFALAALFVTASCLAPTDEKPPLAQAIGAIGAPTTVLQAQRSNAGIVLDESFYNDVILPALVSQNQGRTGIANGDMFKPYFETVNQELAGLAAPLNDGLYGAFQSATHLLKYFDAELFGAICFIEAGIYAACEKDLLQAAACFEQCVAAANDNPGCALQPNLMVDVPLDTVHGVYTLQDVTADVQSDGVELTVQLSDVGLLFGLHFVLDLGECKVAERTTEVYGVVPSVTYTVKARYDDNSPTGIAYTTLLKTLGGPPQLLIPGAPSGDQTAQILFDLANKDINGKDLDDQVQSFITDGVPGELDQVFRQLLEPYFPSAVSALDIQAGQQAAKFAEEKVVGSPQQQLVRGPFQADYESFVSLTDGRLQRQFSRQFEALSAAPPFPLGPNAATFAPQDADMPFANEAAPIGMGTVYVDSAFWEYTNEAMSLTGVDSILSGALLPPNKDASVVIRMSDLAPEHLPPAADSPAFNRQLDHLLNDDPSDPLPSKIFPVPLDEQQKSDLSAKVGSVDLHKTMIRVDIGPVANNSTKVNIAPLDPTPPGQTGSGTVEQRLALIMRIFGPSGQVLLEEFLVGVFQSDLLLKHVTEGTESHIEMTTRDTRLIDLDIALTGGIPAPDAVAGTPTNSAQVRLFLRALFGDRDVLANDDDPRSRLIVEAITAQVAARFNKAKVHLPAAGFKATDSGLLAGDIDLGLFDGTPDNASGNKLKPGLQLSLGRLCSKIRRFYSTPTIVGGSPLPSEPALAIDLDWTEVTSTPPEAQVIMSGTPLAAQPQQGETQIDLDSALATLPSLRDDAVMRIDLQPAAGTEVTSLTTASGFYTTPWQKGAQGHIVAATFAGYQRARNDFGGATVELVPYRDGLEQFSPQCDLVSPFPTDNPSTHHIPSNPDVLVAVAAKGAYCCGGPNGCKQERIVWRHRAPLFKHCYQQGQDQGNITIDPVIISEPLDSYSHTPDVCFGGGAGGAGGDQ